MELEGLEGFAETDMRCRHGTIHFAKRSYGNAGACLVLLHGLGANMRAFSKFIPLLSREISLVVPDLLGHGESSKPDMDYTVEAQAEAVGELMSRECSGRIFLMGHSYGGWIATKLAQSATLSGLIIEDGAVLTTYMKRFEPSTSNEYRERLLKEVLMVNGNRKEVMESIMGNYYKEGGIPDEQLKEMRVPTLIIWGGSDRIIDASYADVLHGLMPASTVAIIEGSGHEPHYSKAAETAARVNEFIKGCMQ